MKKRGSGSAAPRPETKKSREKRTRRELADLEGERPADDLFVVDKKGSGAEVDSTERWRKKALKPDLVLDQLMERIPGDKPKKRKPKMNQRKPVKPAEKLKKEMERKERATAKSSISIPNEAELMDLWANTKVEPVPAWEEGWIPLDPKERPKALAPKRKPEDLFKPKAAVHNKVYTDAGHGLSYNPDPEAHQDRVGEATAHEVKLAAEVKRIEQKLKRTNQKDDTEVNERALADMVNFINSGMRVVNKPRKSNDNDGDSDSDSEELRRNQGKKPGRRNRKRDMQKKRALHRRRKTHLIKQLANLNQHILALDREQSAKEVADLARKQRRLLNKAATRRLNARVYKPSRPAVLLEDDLPSSLRTLGNDKPLQGNRVQDLFESFQRRNMLAVTVRQKRHKRHPMKHFEKPTDRQEWERMLKDKYAEFTTPSLK